MLEGKNMKERHLHFDIESLDHMGLDSKDPCFLVEEYLAVELQYAIMFLISQTVAKLIKVLRGILLQ